MTSFQHESPASSSILRAIRQPDPLTSSLYGDDDAHFGFNDTNSGGYTLEVV